MDKNISRLLRDIKPLVDIPDNSVYLYWSIILIGVLLLGILIFVLIKKIRGFKIVNMPKHYLKMISNIEWRDPKKAAYQATYYGRLLATDDRRVELFDQLLPLLEQYKYKKEVARIDKETKAQLELYIKVCNESI